MDRFYDHHRNAVLCSFATALHDGPRQRFEWFIYSDQRSPAGMIRGKPAGNPPRNTLRVCPIMALCICHTGELSCKDPIAAGEVLGISDILEDLLFAIDEEPYSDLGMYIQSALGMCKRFLK
jgi:hypothetical protein